MMAVHKINKLPSKLLNSKSPYKVLYGKIPNYYYLRVFECLAYVLKTKREGKFDEKGRSGVFVGYPLGQKGCKVLDLVTNEIIISRNVYFIENKFPFNTCMDKPNCNKRCHAKNPTNFRETAQYIQIQHEIMEFDPTQTQGNSEEDNETANEGDIKSHQNHMEGDHSQKNHQQRETD